MNWLRAKVKEVVESAVAQLFSRKPRVEVPEMRALDELRDYPPDLGPFIRRSVEEVVHEGASDLVPEDADDRQ